MSVTRKQPDERRLEIIGHFVKLATVDGYTNVTREQVATSAEISPALVTRYFNNSMDDLRDDVVRYCIKNEKLRIIAQALATCDPLVLEIPQELKEKTVEILLY